MTAGSTFYRGRRVLVTGASGFIGGHLCRRLAAEGAQLYGTTRRPPSPESFPIEWISGDLRENDAVHAAFEKAEPEVVFHLASVVSGSRDLSLVIPTLEANLVVAVQLMTEAVARGSRVVLAGSLEEPENVHDAPTSPYAAAKSAQQMYANMFHSLYGASVVTARLFMVYGPDQKDRAKLLPYVIGSLLRGEQPSVSSGSREVDWLFVDDAVDALLLLGEKEGLSGKAIDVGSGTLTSVRSVVEQVSALVDPRAEVAFGARPDRAAERVRVAEVAATDRAIGWRAATPLADGLAKTVAWYRMHFQDRGE